MDKKKKKEYMNYKGNIKYKGSKTLYRKVNTNYEKWGKSLILDEKNKCQVKYSILNPAKKRKGENKRKKIVRKVKSNKQTISERGR